MNFEYIFFLILICLILFIVYFVTAKGDKKKISITNSEGSEIFLNVEIADNFTTRAKGLMGRSSLGEYEGMLFVFDQPGYYGFWMMNTSIPLDAIFIAENGTVVDIIEMNPGNYKLYKPKEMAKYVLEVNQYFSTKNSIFIGKSNVALPEK
ncbi:DUF192 domain-containing protein [Candidatus Micrarchaeota archaeon]|nr:DUF192 domain-containing protein [Candidatus Micrarchaeota archaeon]